METPPNDRHDCDEIKLGVDDVHAVKAISIYALLKGRSKHENTEYELVVKRQAPTYHTLCRVTHRDLYLFFCDKAGIERLPIFGVNVKLEIKSTSDSETESPMTALIPNDDSLILYS